MNRMIDTALGLEPLWKNALGDDWKQRISREKIRSLYVRM
jgi:3-deoxy-alpha-D-manno-octulosonate 8-oxidase